MEDIDGHTDMWYHQSTPVGAYPSEKDYKGTNNKPRETTKLE